MKKTTRYEHSGRLVKLLRKLKTIFFFFFFFWGGGGGGGGGVSGQGIERRSEAFVKKIQKKNLLEGGWG